MLKKIKTLDILLVFGLCFLFHFLYDWFPNGLFSILFPVNESIWEHMKLIVTSFYVVGIFDYIYFTKKNIKFNNFLFQLFIIPIIGIILYLIIYLPIYNLIGENIIFSIGLLFIIIIVEEIISYFLLSYEQKFHWTIGLIGLIITYIILGYLTYKPVINYILYDETTNRYGLNTYKKEE